MFGDGNTVTLSVRADMEELRALLLEYQAYLRKTSAGITRLNLQAYVNRKKTELAAKHTHLRLDVTPPLSVRVWNLYTKLPASRSYADFLLSSSIDERRYAWFDDTDVPMDRKAMYQRLVAMAPAAATPAVAPAADPTDATTTIAATPAAPVDATAVPVDVPTPAVAAPVSAASAADATTTIAATPAVAPADAADATVVPVDVPTPPVAVPSDAELPDLVEVAEGTGFFDTLRARISSATSRSLTAYETSEGVRLYREHLNGTPLVHAQAANVRLVFKHLCNKGRTDPGLRTIDLKKYSKVVTKKTIMDKKEQLEALELVDKYTQGGLGAMTLYQKVQLKQFLEYTCYIEDQSDVFKHASVHAPDSRDEPASQRVRRLLHRVHAEERPAVCDTCAEGTSSAAAPDLDEWMQACQIST